MGNTGLAIRDGDADGDALLTLMEFQLADGSDTEAGHDNEQRRRSDGRLAIHSVNKGIYTGLGSAGIGRQPIDTGHFTLRNGGMPPVMP